MVETMPLPLPEQAQDAGPPTPLLAQAEQRLREATARVHALPRALDQRPPGVTWEAYATAQREARQAHGEVEKRTRSRDLLQIAIPEARRSRRLAQSTFADGERQRQQASARERRHVQLAEDDEARLVRDLISIAGVAAVPPEEA